MLQRRTTISTQIKPPETFKGQFPPAFLTHRSHYPFRINNQRSGSCLHSVFTKFVQVGQRFICLSGYCISLRTIQIRLRNTEGIRINRSRVVFPFERGVNTIFFRWRTGLASYRIFKILGKAQIVCRILCQQIVGYHNLPGISIVFAHVRFECRDSIRQQNFFIDKRKEIMGIIFPELIKRMGSCS